MDDLYTEIELNKNAKEKRFKELQDLAFLLESEQGKRFFSRLIHNICGFAHSSFTGDEKTNFNEGQRNVALAIFADIVEIDPNLYAQLLMTEKE